MAAPLSIAQLLPTVTLGGVPQFVSFTGLAPGFVALGQGNIVLSEPLSAALSQKGNGVTTLPLVMDFGGSASPPVDLPVDLTVPPPAGADLGVRADAVFPAMAVSKDRISVQYQVMNPDGFMGDVERSFYLSTDGNISPDTDTLMNTRPVTLNGEGQVFDSRFNPLPPDLPLGKYFVGIVLSIRVTPTSPTTRPTPCRSTWWHSARHSTWPSRSTTSTRPSSAPAIRGRNGGRVDGCWA